MPLASRNETKYSSTSDIINGLPNFRKLKVPPSLSLGQVRENQIIGNPELRIDGFVSPEVNLRHQKRVEKFKNQWPFGLNGNERTLSGVSSAEADRTMAIEKAFSFKE